MCCSKKRQQRLAAQRAACMAAGPSGCHHTGCHQSRCGQQRGCGRKYAQCQQCLQPYPQAQTQIPRAQFQPQQALVNEPPSYEQLLRDGNIQPDNLPAEKQRFSLGMLFGRKAVIELDGKPQS